MSYTPENAVEIDADESGEYEAETERGGEVALEQFWLNMYRKGVCHHEYIFVFLTLCLGKCSRLLHLQMAGRR